MIKNEENNENNQLDSHDNNQVDKREDINEKFNKDDFDIYFEEIVQQYKTKIDIVSYQDHYFPMKKI